MFRTGLKRRCWVIRCQHRLFTAVRPRAYRAGLKSRCWVIGSQHRLFTAVRPPDVPHRPEEPVLGTTIQDTIRAV